MYPIEMLCDLLGLIGLDRTDEVPFEAKFVQFDDFRDAFIHIVFPERALAGSGSRSDGTRAVPLADGQKRHRIAVAFCDTGRICDAFGDRGQVFRDPSHALPQVLRYTRSSLFMVNPDLPSQIESNGR